MNSKICIKCNIEKTLEKFNKNKNKKDGVSSLCKECHSKYRREHYLLNKEKIISQVNAYRNNNPDKYIPVKKVMNSFNKKAGRTVEIKCLKCENYLFVNIKDGENSVKKYCSRECKKLDNKSAFHYHLKNIMTRARKINKEFNLNEDFLKDLLEFKQKNKCAISSLDIFIKHPSYDLTTLYDSASLDRIDNSKGYVVGNVQWVALGINYMKMDFDEIELHHTLKLIKEKYENGRVVEDIGLQIQRDI